MTRAIDLAGPPGPLGLDDCIATLKAMRFDPRDEEGLAACAPALAGLAAERSFLGTLMIEELRHRGRRQERGNDYGAQVLMLHKGEGWFLRANIWPAAGDLLLRRNGAARFFYGVPHDHNFSFLTVGYLGPGYWSDYYTYEDEEMSGVPGDPVALRLVERSCLGEGRMLLYRAHRDIHCQHPPDALSVSLNLVENGGGEGFRDQYRFDLQRGVIAAQLAHTATEAMLAMLPELGGGEGLDLLDRFARRHPCDRIRFGAISAQAGAASDLAGRAAILERATRTSGRQIAALAQQQLDALDASRAWIECTPA